MSRYRNAGLFVLLAALWGSAFVAIKAGLAYFPPVLFAAIRYDIAGAIMLGYAIVVTNRWRPRTRDDWLEVLVGATLIIAAYHASSPPGSHAHCSPVKVSPSSAYSGWFWDLSVC